MCNLCVSCPCRLQQTCTCEADLFPVVETTGQDTEVLPLWGVAQHKAQVKDAWGLVADSQLVGWPSRIPLQC